MLCCTRSIYMGCSRSNGPECFTSLCKSFRMFATDFILQKTDAVCSSDLTESALLLDSEFEIIVVIEYSTPCKHCGSRRPSQSLGRWLSSQTRHIESAQCGEAPSSFKMRSLSFSDAHTIGKTVSERMKYRTPCIVLRIINRSTTYMNSMSY